MNIANFSRVSPSTSITPRTHLTTAFAVVISTAAFYSAEDVGYSQTRLPFVDYTEVSSLSKASSSVPSAGTTSFDKRAPSSGSMARVEQEIEWVPSSLDRIENLGSLPANWGGEGYQRAAESAVGDAERFLMKLVHIGMSIPPAIGLDDDGSFSFHIAANDLIADLSVHADGTYSYFAQRGEAEVFSDSKDIDGPIDEQLAQILKT